MNKQVGSDKVAPVPLASRRFIVIFLVSLFSFVLTANALGGEQEAGDVVVEAEYGQWVGLGANSASDGGISANSGISGDASLAIAPDGSPIVAWEDNSGGNVEIYVRRWNGTAWAEMGGGSASGGGISNNGGSSENPSLAIGQDGNPVVAWEDNSSGNIEIYVRRWNGSGWVEMGSGSGSGRGISNSVGPSRHPSLAIGPDGMPVAAWDDNPEDCGGYCPAQIYVRRWNGSDWVEIGSGSASGGGITDNDVVSLYPSLAIGPDGIPIIAMHEFFATMPMPEIYVFRWNGSDWVHMGGSVDQGLSDSATSPSLAIGPDNTPIVVWENFAGNNEIYLRRWNGSDWVEMGSGSASGGGISNSGGYSYAPALAVSPDGTPIVAWQDGSDGDNEIYVSHWNGTAWEEMGTGSASSGGISDNEGDSRFTTLAINSNGIPIVAWDDDSSDNREIYVRRWKSDKSEAGEWVEVGEESASGHGISENAQIAFEPSLAIDQAGRPVVAWYDYLYEAKDSEVYLLRWNGTDWVEMGSNSASSGGISANSGASVSPSLAIGVDGSTVVAWEDNSAGDSEIYVRRWNSSAWVEIGGGSASDGGISNDDGVSAAPSAVVDLQGNPIIAWQDSSGIYVRRFDGSAWVEMGSGSFSGGGISNTGDFQASSPSLAISSDGEAIIAWSDTSSGNSEIYVRRWNGSSWVEMGSGSASGGGISNNAGDSSSPSLSIGPDGKPVVAWSDNSVGSQIYVRRWNGSSWIEVGSGSATGGGVSDDDLSADEPTLAIGLDGEPIVAWQGWRRIQQIDPPYEFLTDIYQFVRHWNGKAWVEMGTGSASGSGINSSWGDPYNPSMGVDPSGIPIISWSNYDYCLPWLCGATIFVRQWQPSIAQGIENGEWREVGGSASGSGISGGGGNSLLPSIALDPDGSECVAWQNDATGNFEIYARCWDGTNWKEVGSGSASGGGISSNSGDSLDPSLVISSNGTPFVAWTDDSSGNSEIYLRRWNGTAWVEAGGSASGGGISKNSGDSRLSSLAVGSDGRPIVAWMDNSGGGYEIYVRRWNGSSWVEMGSGSASGGGISASGGAAFDPALAIGTDGRPIIAWEDGSSGDWQIYVRRWNGTAWVEMGGSASEGGISSTAGFYSTQPSLAVGNNGNPVVAWADRVGDVEAIYVRRWNGSEWEEVGNGSASGKGISASDGASSAPSLGISYDGNPIVAWQDYSSDEWQIYVRRWNGEYWVELSGGSASGDGISDNYYPSETPALAVGTDGTTAIAWYDYWNGAIYLKRWQPTIEPDTGNSEWGEMSGSASGGGISDSSGYSDSASTATMPDGTPIVAWSDDSSGDSEIYVRRWNGSAWVEMGSGSASGGGISDNRGTSGLPSLAISRDGVPMVAWSDNSSNATGLHDFQIYVRRWNGTAWVEMGSHSASGGGISNTFGNSGDASLAIGPDGVPIVAWSDETPSPGQWEIYVRRWNGTAWVEMGSGSASGGGISNTGDWSGSPSLAVGNDGTPFIAWHERAADDIFQIYVRRWNGTSWVEMGGGSATGGGISNTIGNSFDPTVSIDPDGRPVVAWEDSSSGEPEIYVRRWNGTAWVEMGSGSASGGGISAVGQKADQISQVGSPSDDGTSHPSMAMGADGAAVIAWTELAGGNLEIYARQWNGRAWSEFGDSASGGGISDTSGLSSKPTVAIGHAGAPIIAWEDNSSGKMQIYLRRWQPGYALYFPAQEMEPGLGWKAGMQVQNKGTAEANMFFSGYEAGGKEVECEAQAAAPGASVTFLTDYSCPSGHAPFSAAVIRAEQPAVAIANVNNRGVGLAAGQYRGIDEGESDTQVFFPLVKNEHVGRTTGFFVQNASDGPLDVVAIFRVQGQYQEKQYKNVPPNSSIFVLPGDANVPPGLGQVGSLTVVAPGPIAGSAVEFEAGVSILDNLQASRGFTPAESDNILYCPLFRNAHAKRLQTTGVQVQNVTEAAQRIDFTYVPVDGGQTVTASEQVAPGASATFYAPHLGIPAGSLGAVTLEGEGDLVAVVNDQGFDKGQRNVAAYSCFPAGQATKRVYIPLYKEMYQGNTTGIQVQNVAGDGSGAKVTLTYRVSNSSAVVVFTHENPIPDGGSITFWGVSSLAQPQGIKVLSGDAALLEKTVGSVEIMADRPIVAIANETSYGADASGQDAKNYEGFNN